MKLLTAWACDDDIALASSTAVAGSPGYVFEQADIRDAPVVADILERHQPNAVLHLAAESHVDRSIDRPGDFVTVRIEEPPISQVAVLPAAALDAGARVLVVAEDERLESIDARLLRRQMLEETQEADEAPAAD